MSSRKRKTKPARMSNRDLSDNEFDDVSNGGIQLPVDDEPSLDDVDCSVSANNNIKRATTNAMASRNFSDGEDDLPTDLRASVSSAQNSNGCSRTWIDASAAASGSGDYVDGTSQLERTRSAIGDDVMETIQSALSSAETIEDKQRRLNAMIRQLEVIRANLACQGELQHGLRTFAEVRYLNIVRRAYV